jgi:hypothetical protein
MEGLLALPLAYQSAGLLDYYWVCGLVVWWALSTVDL